jgi:hypothetical protein
MGKIMNHWPISQELRLLKAIEMLIRVDFLYTQEIVTSENGRKKFPDRRYFSH